MATKIDSAEKAFEAATVEVAAKPVAAPAAAPVKATPVAAPVAATVKAVPAKAKIVMTVPAKAKIVMAKAKPVAAKKAVVIQAAVKKIAPKPAKITQAATKPVAAAAKGLKVMNDTVKKFADETKTRMETLTTDMNGRTKEAMEKSGKLAEEAVAFNKANLEALVEAGKIAAKNMEVLGQEVVAFGRKSVEEATVAVKGYSAVKTPADFFKLYAENSKKAFDAAVAQTSKTSELVVKMANDSFAPISNRVSVITSKMKSAA